ncbi:MAG: SufS family cysteine desulfurase [Flavobacteriales bacterium]|nr:SufS family cysteine desulfurase [Flavobacteriales bacterium]
MNNEALRAEFSILSRKVNGQPLVYLDNAASSQKPDAVIEAIDRYYHNEHSNVHRGVHFLSQLATEKFEAARETMRAFVNAAETREVIFTKGTTDGINLVANCMARSVLRPGDEILISEMEHHSNIVPWQMAAEQSGAILVVVDTDASGQLVMEDFYAKLNKRTKMVSVVHISNSLGTVNPVKEIAKAAHKFGAKVLVDGAQGAPHGHIDVRDIDCDFYTLSAHKMYGPTGMGILYGKAAELEALPPYQGGGEMIKDVTFEKTTYNELPFKFEAGTPNIAGAIGMAAAADWMAGVGHDKIRTIEKNLLEYATEQLSEVEGIRFFGTAEEKTSVISFLVDGTHPYDMGAIIDKMGVAVRTGHHCTQPLMAKYGIPGTVRASFAVYNTYEDIDTLTAAVKRAAKMLK